jgi:hypothetical protein
MLEVIGLWFSATLDKVTTQALTAAAALAAAILGPTVSICIGRLQFRTANKQINAAILQKSIDSLRDRVADVISAATEFYTPSMKDPRPLPEAIKDWGPEQLAGTLKLTLLISQIELMLDSGKESHISLIHSLDKVRHTCFQGNRQLDQFPGSVVELKKHCRIVLQQWKHEQLVVGGTNPRRRQAGEIRAE